MSFLDLYPETQDYAKQPQARETGGMPVGFADTFSAAWNEGRMFSQSTSGGTAHMAALSDYLDMVHRETGQDISRDVYSRTDVVQAAQDKVAKLKEENPSLDLPDLTPQWLDDVAKGKAQAARKDYVDTMSREHSGMGSFLGSTAAALSDPVNLAALAFAPAEGAGVLATALRWAGIGAASQTAVEAVGGQFREQAQPGYLASGEPLANIAESAAGAATIGGATKLLGNAWTAVKGRWWPQSVRDAGNVIESRADVLHSNVYPGAEGEAAHQDALSGAIDDVTAGRPVDVSQHITPEREADLDRRFSVITDSVDRATAAQDTAKAERAALPSGELPFQATAAEAQVESAVGKAATEIEKLGVPQDAAKAVADRLTKVSPDEASGILRQLAVSPNQAEQLARAAPKDEPAQAALQPDAAMIKDTELPDHVQAMRADLDRERAMGDKQLPVGVDQDGNPIMGSLDKMLGEVDERMAAADELQTCAAPAQEAEEAA